MLRRMSTAGNPRSRPAGAPDNPDSFELLTLLARLGKLNDLVIGDLLETLPHPEVHGYGQVECIVLTSLYMAGPPYQLSPGELCRLSLQSPSGMTKTLARLQEAGLVRRGQDAADRRSLPVALTPKGRKVAEGNVAQSIRRYSAIVADLSGPALASLNQSLRGVLALLEREVQAIQARAR